MFDKRGELYLLHYYLNHTNLFGCKGLGMRSMLCTCCVVPVSAWHADQRPLGKIFIKYQHVPGLRSAIAAAAAAGGYYNTSLRMMERLVDQI